MRPLRAFLIAFLSGAIAGAAAGPGWAQADWPTSLDVAEQGLPLAEDDLHAAFKGRTAIVGLDLGGFRRTLAVSCLGDGAPLIIDEGEAVYVGRRTCKIEGSSFCLLDTDTGESGCFPVRTMLGWSLLWVDDLALLEPGDLDAEELQSFRESASGVIGLTELDFAAVLSRPGKIVLGPFSIVLPEDDPLELRNVIAFPLGLRFDSGSGGPTFSVIVEQVAWPDTFAVPSRDGGGLLTLQQAQSWLTSWAERFRERGTWSDAMGIVSRTELSEEAMLALDEGACVRFREVSEIVDFPKDWEGWTVNDARRVYFRQACILPSAGALTVVTIIPGEAPDAETQAMQRDRALAVLDTISLGWPVEPIDNARRHSADVSALADKGATDEALSLADRLVREAPDDARELADVLAPFVSAGRVLYRDDAFAESAALFARVMEIAARADAASRDTAEMRRLLARLSYNEGRALRRDSRYEAALQAQAAALSQGGDLLAADPKDSRMIELLGNIHYERGRSLQSLGRRSEAIEAYRDAVRYDSDDDISYRRIGVIAFELGDYEEAIDALETSVRLDPDYESAINWLAWVYATAGLPDYRQPDRAVQLARMVLDLEATGNRYDTLGAALLAAGDTEGARVAYLEAAAKDAKYASRQAEQLARAGCLGEAAEPTAEERGAALMLCLGRGVPPFVVEDCIERIARIAAADPATAQRHRAALLEMYPAHPAVTRLAVEASGRD